MSEYNYSGNSGVGDGGKRRFGRVGMFFIGLLGGGIAGGSLAAFFVKRKCEADKEEAVENAIQESSKQAQDWIDKNIVAKPAEKEDIHKKIGRLFSDNSENSEPDAVYEVELPPDMSVLEDMTVEIDDKEATDEALEMTEQHDRYLEMVEKYQGNPALRPRKISREEFENNHHYEKVYISWYDDGVFGVDADNDSAIQDPYSAFGTADGLELFRNADREDPDTVHIRNERDSIDYEITRAHNTYAKVKSGEVYFNEANR